MKAMSSTIRLLLSLLVLASDFADAATTTRSNSDEEIKDEAPAENVLPPIDVDVVMEVATKQVWEKLFPDTQEKTPLLIAGSYAAAVKMYERDGTITQYNDIDVFVGHPYPENLSGEEADYCQAAVPGHFMGNVLAVQNVYDAFHLRHQKDLPPLNIVVLCSLDPEPYVENSDINAVSVGFVVEPKPCGNFLKSKACPEMSRWIVSEPFEKFMDDPSKTVMVKNPFPRGGQHGFKSIVRLLKKASQLDLPFKFPSDEELIAMDIDGRYIQDFSKAMFDALPSEYQKEIWNRFDIYYTMNGKFVLRKKSIGFGKEVPGAIKLHEDLLMGRRHLRFLGGGFSGSSTSNRIPSGYSPFHPGSSTVIQTELVDIGVFQNQNGNEVVQISSHNDNKKTAAIKTMAQEVQRSSRCSQVANQDYNNNLGTDPVAMGTTQQPDTWIRKQ